MYGGLGFTSYGSSGASANAQSGVVGGMTGSTANAQSFGQTGQGIYPGISGYGNGLYPNGGLSYLNSGSSSNAQASSVSQGVAGASSSQAQSSSASGLLGF